MKTFLLIVAVLFILPVYSQIVQFKANLYAVTTVPVDTVLADGNSVVFGSPYSNTVDNDDVRKSGNIGENYGVLRNGVTLAIEARQPIVTFDTIFYRVWNLQTIQYMIQFVPKNFDIPGLTIMFQDSLLPANNVPLSKTDTSNIFVNITSAPGSGAQTRFRVVFKISGTLPISFTSFTTTAAGEGVDVNWKVEGDKEVSKYDIEYSTDSRNFYTIGSEKAKTNSGLSAYHWLHTKASKGVNYYRIKSTTLSGELKYTGISKVTFGNIRSNFSITPNPVTSNQIHIQFNTEPEGKYECKLMNNLGQILQSQTIMHTGGNGSYLLAIKSSLHNGIYHLEITNPNKERTVKSVYIKILK